MSELRKAAQDVVTVWKMHGTAESLRGWMDILEAALAQEQEQKQKLLEAVRVRIMSTAYDCADDGEVEAYNSVKVLCTEVLEMLK